MIIKLIIFIIASIGITFISRDSFSNIRSYGFFRFFAFELNLALILLNIDFWFTNPFSTLQIFSWLCLFLSIFLVVHGFRLLKTTGSSEGKFEHTTILVRKGVFKYIRHPMYASLLYLGLGVYFKNISLITSILVLFVIVSLAVTAKFEEIENSHKFAGDYVQYIKNTKMFIPYLF